MAKPSPGNCTTPLMGVSENGGTNAATSVFMASVNFCVSQVPSTIIAALPTVKLSRLFVLVSTSELVHPLDFRAAHLDSCAVFDGSFQGMFPLYRPFQSA